MVVNSKAKRWTLESARRSATTLVVQRRSATTPEEMSVGYDFWLPGFAAMSGGEDHDATSSAVVDEALRRGSTSRLTTELLAHDGYTTLSIWVDFDGAGIQRLVNRAPMPETPWETIDYARVVVRLNKPS
jgi:hypothetical protein